MLKFLVNSTKLTFIALLTVSFLGLSSALAVENAEPQAEKTKYATASKVVDDSDIKSSLLINTPTAEFTYPANGTTTYKNYTMVKVDVTLWDADFVGEDLRVCLLINDTKEITADSTLEYEDICRKVNFSSATEVISIMFPDPSFNSKYEGAFLYHEGANYFGCLVETLDGRDGNYCGGVEDPDTLRVNFAQNPLYRFWGAAPEHNSHFFTVSPDERDVIIDRDATWEFEGEGFGVSPLKGATMPSGSETAGNSECHDDSATPVYRFYNFGNGTHFFTGSLAERDLIRDTDDAWTYEGEVFCAFGMQVPVSEAVYRFYNNQSGSHFYTISPEEKEMTEGNSMWTFEGVAFYAVP